MEKNWTDKDMVNFAREAIFYYMFSTGITYDMLIEKWKKGYMKRLKKTEKEVIKRLIMFLYPEASFYVRKGKIFVRLRDLQKYKISTTEGWFMLLRIVIDNYCKK